MSHWLHLLLRQNGQKNVRGWKEDRPSSWRTSGNSAYVPWVLVYGVVAGWLGKLGTLHIPHWALKLPKTPHMYEIQMFFLIPSYRHQPFQGLETNPWLFVQSSDFICYSLLRTQIKSARYSTVHPPNLG